MKCAQCNSEKIAQGRIFNQTDYISPAAYFRPNGLRPFALLDINVRIKNIFYACLECGHLWAQVDQKKVSEIIKVKGSEATKKKLSL
jgi:uncharacterized Zn finger protein